MRQRNPETRCNRHPVVIDHIAATFDEHPGLALSGLNDTIEYPTGMELDPWARSQAYHFGVAVAPCGRAGPALRANDHVKV
jgi:hypothetical protein